MALLEGEYVLDGYAFGTVSHPVVVLSGGLDTGSPGVRTQDAQVRDDTLFGRDYLTGPTWAFTLGVDAEDADAVLSDLARVWRNPAIRHTPGAMSVLRFRRGSRDYRVYGRPREFGVIPEEVASDDWRRVEANFRVADTFMYTDEADTRTLRLGEITEDDGLVLPETMPWLLGSQGASDSAVINVQTLDPTPFEVVIRAGQAPLSQMTVEGPGWAIDVDHTLQPGESLTIDTRAATILQDGASIAGALSRRSSLKARLWAGASTISFVGRDTSGTATAEFIWRGSYPIL